MILGPNIYLEISQLFAFFSPYLYKVQSGSGHLSAVIIASLENDDNISKHDNKAYRRKSSFRK